MRDGGGDMNEGLELPWKNMDEELALSLGTHYLIPNGRLRRDLFWGSSILHMRYPGFLYLSYPVVN